MTERLLGIDLGDVRTGIAVSDPFGMLASGIETVSGLNDYELADKIRTYAVQYGVKSVVMGIPVNMDGSQGFRADKVRAFAAYLTERTGLQVILYDERLSTVEASRYLNETNTRGKKRKAAIDTLSAQIILQNYLDSRKRA